MELPQEAQDKIKQLSGYEQKLQALGLQRHKVETELSEVESAITALKDAKEAFKIIGNVMVDADKAALKSDLETQKKKVTLRISSLEKQEDQLRQLSEAVQAQVLKQLKGG